MQPFPHGKVSFGQRPTKSLLGSTVVGAGADTDEEHAIERRTTPAATAMAAHTPPRFPIPQA
jgi:hypothetical protein